MESPVRYRALAEGDWPSILELDRRRYGSDSWSKYFVRMAPLLFGELSRVAELDSALVGYSLVARQNEVCAWLLALVVEEAFTGRGIGRSMLVRCLDAVWGAGCREVRLSVSPDNDRALRLYDHFGFRKVGQDPAFFGPDEPRVLLALSISTSCSGA